MARLIKRRKPAPVVDWSMVEQERRQLRLFAESDIRVFESLKDLRVIARRNDQSAHRRGDEQRGD